MLNVLTSIETIPAQSIFDKLKFSELMWAPTKRVTIDELTKILQIKGKNPILTGVYIRGDQEFSGSLENIEHIEPPAIIKVDRLGVFLGDKLVGWLTIDESKGYNYIVNNVKSTVINVPCAEDETDVVAIEITETDTKIKAGMKHDHPTIEVNILVEANVGEVQCELDLNQSGNIKHLEDQIEKKIKEVMDRAIQKAQSEFKSDIFGFGVALHRAHPNAWRTLKDEWDEVFPNIAVTTNVEAHIRHLGTTANPIQAEGGK